MKKGFEFYAPMKIYFGEASLKQLPLELQGERIFIVMDKFLYESQLKNQIDKVLHEKKIQYFTDFLANPDIISMNHALCEIRKFNASSVVGIGGGSTLDIAKFLAAAMKETYNVEEIQLYGFSKNTKVKSICIPTTAGTGSEVTNVSVISNYKTREKSPFVNDLLFADVAILDSILTMSLPQTITASCGMDTLCHAIEAFWNKNANELSDILATEAMRLVFGSLKSCYVSSKNENVSKIRKH